MFADGIWIRDELVIANNTYTTNTQFQTQFQSAQLNFKQPDTK